jgi:hypothetical protein
VRYEKRGILNRAFPLSSLPFQYIPSSLSLISFSGKVSGANRIGRTAKNRKKAAKEKALVGERETLWNLQERIV